MALIVEDGTGKANAQSLASVAEYRAEMALRGVVVTAETDADIESRLYLGFNYMLGMYRFRWSGQRKTTTQNSDFPRYMMPIYDVLGGAGFYYDDSSVPTEAKTANILLAYKAKTITLLPDIKPNLLSKSIAGAISKTYDPNSSPYTKYSEIESMLKPFFTNGGSKGFVHR